MLIDIVELIEQADMVLVGLGEEFNDISAIKEKTDYLEGRRRIEEQGRLWSLPAYEEYCRSLVPKRQSMVEEALGKLVEMLQNKNYFVVSTSVNPMIHNIPWKDGRLVMPCGGIHKKQCPDGCSKALQDISEEEKEQISDVDSIIKLGNCPSCGKPLIFNNIYAEKYDENGYLSQWQLYTRWLQGTLNRKVLILELGVGMKFPSVIRWPFEKVAFFNNKASFCRVNETLYQMSEELKDKGISIAKNSIDWLRSV